MKTNDDKFGVLLFEHGWKELGNILEPYEQNGPIGKYLYCKKIETIGQFIMLTLTPEQVNGRIKDEMTIWIPVSFVKFIASSTEANAKPIGFIQ